MSGSSNHQSSLFLKGTFLPDGKTGIKGRRSWGPFHAMMNHSHAIDDNRAKGTKVHPVATKFCPPNYILDGIRVKTTRKKIRGITGLHCRQSANNNAAPIAGSPTVIVGLDAGESGVEGYEMFGNPYTLDQRIGNPRKFPLTNEVEFTFVCENGFLSGLELSHDKFGQLDNFRPFCTSYQL